ncbi:GNAT family N-acetyltransferase [Saccharibacillus sp. CPCC 101409]|uniref:GNAT family N-acetyltransferase n=1 Tax=Saccharibacillus sp. CPCC 101409 TaxID=3058041 RepID=UPI0026736EC9|nr:GNAT family N-acetyltransferase [Saccharibacillus sp. CPCC 101409]MDO3411085.1 GNAT family N-acetyltransferase [Saccharibacillus sp. CPCC 101409]
MKFELRDAANEEQLQSCKNIRKTVFVDEQGVALEDEFDEWDVLRPEVRHILAFDGNVPVATSRLRRADGCAKLERICILQPYRKYGLGRLLIARLEELARADGLNKAKLHGQTQAAGFYEKLGYSRGSEEFMEDGIPHLLMVKTLD